VDRVVIVDHGRLARQGPLKVLTMSAMPMAEKERLRANAAMRVVASHAGLTASLVGTRKGYARCFQA
jgi:hypothetical protein